ncbi:MAG TPA: hypothetical protein DCE18_20860 [Syntrophobacteraceae bacterium]|nr:hypothetical protein [Syntrophobacteraceae bacterium]
MQALLDNQQGHCLQPNPLGCQAPCFITSLHQLSNHLNTSLITTYQNKKAMGGNPWPLFSIHDQDHVDGLGRAVGPRTWAPRLSKRLSNWRSPKLSTTGCLCIPHDPKMIVQNNYIASSALLPPEWK